jgi:hypothetical protein
MRRCLSLSDARRNSSIMLSIKGTAVTHAARGAAMLAWVSFIAPFS